MNQKLFSMMKELEIKGLILTEVLQMSSSPTCQGLFKKKSQTLWGAHKSMLHQQGLSVHYHKVHRCIEMIFITFDLLDFIILTLASLLFYIFLFTIILLKMDIKTKICQLVIFFYIKDKHEYENDEHISYLCMNGHLDEVCSQQGKNRLDLGLNPHTFSHSHHYSQNMKLHSKCQTNKRYPLLECI